MYSYEYKRDKNSVFTIAVESSISTHKHFHNCVELVYAIDGEATVKIDGVDYTLSSGEMCAVSCFSTHYYVTQREGSFIVCLIPRRLFSGYESQFNTNCFKNPIIKDNKEKFLLNLLQAILNLYGKCNFYGENDSGYSPNYAENQFLIFSTFMVSFCLHNCNLRERNRISPLAARAVEIIEDDFQRNINTEYIAKKIGCRQKDLSYNFKKTIGVSIFEYIAHTRTKNAAQLLISHPEFTIETVMIKSGFTSMRSFLRHFKNTFGCTPSEYKKH